jgi:hypothetical protein
LRVDRGFAARLAGLALESVAAWRGLPRRAVWVAALVLSLALPVLGLLMQKQAMGPRTFAIKPC